VISGRRARLTPNGPGRGGIKCQSLFASCRPVIRSVRLNVALSEFSRVGLTKAVIYSIAVMALIAFVSALVAPFYIGAHSPRIPDVSTGHVIRWTMRGADGPMFVTVSESWWMVALWVAFAVLILGGVVLRRVWGMSDGTEALAAELAKRDSSGGL
jgi:hypothetical protein